MHLIYWLVGFAALGPMLAIGAVAVVSRHGLNSISGRRLIVSGAIGGAISTGVVGFLIAIVPEGNLPAIPIGIAVGSLFGGAVGLVSVLLRRLILRKSAPTV